MIDIIDILAVTVVLYQIYRLMRGTRATQMFVGLLILLAAGIVAQVVGMSGMIWLIQSIGAVWVIAFVILFQPELRRMLIRIGQIGFLHGLLRTSGEKVVSAVAKAASELSQRRVGGLIVFQRKTGLGSIIETGVSLQAEVSWELLVTLFIPRAPLHDGAVVIAGESIVAAGCLLPLSTNPNLDSTLGTRHRAALGVSEEVDAVSVVISEETGSISITSGGRFVARGLTERELTITLQRLLDPNHPAEPLPEQADPARAIGEALR